MGVKGTEAAREAASIVLADDNFASIAHAVEGGRTVYENIRKAILYILPTNGAESVALVAAILFGLTMPIVKHSWLVRSVDDLPRVVADALSLLPISERINVLRHLPYPLRDAMKPLCIGGSQRLHMQPWSPAVLAMRHA